MSISKASLFSFIGILTICTTPIFSDLSANEESTTAETQTTEYNNDCQIPAAFTNAEEMAKAIADPAKFMQLVTLMSNPQTAQTMMNCSTESEQWSAWMKNMSNPTYKINAAAVFMNPQVYMNWMTAMMNPQTFQSSMSTFMNPALYMQWMTAMSNPTYYQPMQKMMDPKWQQQSSTWMMDPSNFTQMFSAFTGGQLVAETSAQ